MSALLNGLAASDQVVPPSAVVLIRPPSPTSMHVLALVQAIEIMSPFDGNQVWPPSVLLKNVLTAPQAPLGRNLPYHGVPPDAVPTA